MRQEFRREFPVLKGVLSQRGMGLVWVLGMILLIVLAAAGIRHKDTFAIVSGAGGLVPFVILFRRWKRHSKPIVIVDDDSLEYRPDWPGRPVKALYSSLAVERDVRDASVLILKIADGREIRLSRDGVERIVELEELLRAKTGSVAAPSPVSIDEIELSRG